LVLEEETSIKGRGRVKCRKRQKENIVRAEKNLQYPGLSPFHITQTLTVTPVAIMEHKAQKAHTECLKPSRTKNIA